MPENIKASVKREVSLSMKEGNKFRTTTLRLIVSAFQVEEINTKIELLRCPRIKRERLKIVKYKPNCPKLKKPDG